MFELILVAFQNTSLSDSLASSQKEAQEATSNCSEVKKLNETLSMELIRVRQEARLERKGEKKVKDWFEEKVRIDTALLEVDRGGGLTPFL